MCFIYPAQLVVGDVSVNNEVLVVASLISRYTGPVTHSHSLVEIHKGSVCARLDKGVCVYVSVCICTSQQKNPFRFVPIDFF